MKQERPELTTKLLPCPFCGSEPVAVAYKQRFLAECRNIQCLRPMTDWYKDQNECAQIWNLRYKPVEGK